MIRNFFKVAIRQLLRHKGYSFLNIFGLAMGMVCSLLILLWINDERSVDGYHVNSARLYRVYERQYYDGKIVNGYYTPGLLPAEVQRVMPEVEKATGYTWPEEEAFRAGEKVLKESGCYAGPAYFSMFSYPLLEGNVSTALSSPVGIAISRKMAGDLFGSPALAIGKTVRYRDWRDLKVTAVYEDMPENSTDRYDYVMNWDLFLEENSWAKEWGNNGPNTVLLLRADANPTLVAKKLRKFLDQYNKEQSKGFQIELDMQPFGDVYLHSTFKDGKQAGGRIEYVHLFSLVAIFILLIACINFMNLTTARSVKRSREIGIRKVVGAMRWALVRQFLGEAVLLSCFSVILAIGVILLLLPGFNNLTGKHIAFPFQSGSFWLSLGVLTLLTGLVSGSYPALFLSGFKPIRVLKGAMKFSQGAAWFRKGLVVFQFVLSIVLIIGTIVVAGQVSYVQQANLGFDRDNLATIPLEGELLPKFQVFRERVSRIPGITSVTRISNGLVGMDNGTGGVDWEGKDPNYKPLFVQASVGYDFSGTLKLHFVQGRDFSRDFATDSVGYILNESALAKTGLKDPIGKPLTFWQKKGTIVGIVKDFHFNSLHDPIKPMILRLREKEAYGNAMVRIQAGRSKQVLASLEQVCRELNPQFPFTYRFADEEYQKLYKSETMVHRLANCFAGLAIFISCLGLLGLAMFTAEQRTREFGIRKVLGAKVSGLFGLLSKDFIQLVLIAFVVASPVAWWAMHSWLENFAYHIELSWWVFLLAGVLAMLVALLTVSVQAMKVATANPIKSLRTE